MNEHDSAFAYHQNTAIGASPVGQVVALYDTILRDLHRASAAVEGRPYREALQRNQPRVDGHW